MKKTLLLFLCCLGLGIGFAQNNDACTQRLKDAASAEKRGDYLAALRIYTSARSYCTGNTDTSKRAYNPSSVWFRNLVFKSK
jgi:hypothetical protein